MVILEATLIILLVILLLVGSHELGHFLVAKWNNIRVDEFGLGLPPRVFGKRIGETLYSINLLPFGGFVKILGEEEDISDPRSFSSQSFGIKTLIVAAGVMANVLVGFLIFTSLAVRGIPQFGVEVSRVTEKSPAFEAGFREGDTIIGIRGEAHESLNMEDVLAYIGDTKGKEASFMIRRGDEQLLLQARPRENPPPGEGSLGVALAPKEIGVKNIPWYQAPLEGAKTTISLLYAILLGMGMFFSQFFSEGKVVGEVVGPVGIANIARETFHIGIEYFLQLVALLSLHLAIINILPIPALDGGRILFFVIEKMKGSPMPVRVAHTVHSIFFILLITLLVVITYRDIVHIVTS